MTETKTNTDLRERAVLPVLIPLSAIVLTEVMVFSMSRVLLAADEKQAVVVAFGTSLAILIGATFVAARPRMSSKGLLAALSILALAAVGAGAAAIQRGPHYLKEEAANRPKIELSAKNLSFDKKEIDIPTGGAEIDFANEDTQPHNFAIYPSADAMDKALFKGQIVTAGTNAAYEIPSLAVGTYHFHCDVHPTMMGMVVVKQKSAEKSA